MRTFNSKKIAVAVGLIAAAGAASAQTAGPDYSTITAAVALGPVGVGIVAMGAVKIVPNVVSWGTKKLVGFFR